jgi:hypothetical protein
LAGVFIVDTLGYNPYVRIIHTEYAVILTNRTRFAQIRLDLRSVAVASLWVVLACCGAAPARAETPAEPLRFTGEIDRNDDLSAIASVGRFLAIGSDEGNRIQVLEPDGTEGAYRPRIDSIRLLRGNREVDVEAMAFADGTLYVLGSHSMKRKLVDPDREYLDNRARLATVSPEPHRKRLFRLEIDPETGMPVSSIDSVSLETVLEKDPILGPFARVPAAENGINIEGLGADGETLYLGFRSPVLREGYVPVMVMRFDDPGDYELRFLQLHGAGVRSLARVGDGFLVLAAPEREAGAASVIFHWNGLDQVPGSGGQQGKLERLLELTAPRGGTPEGLAVIAEKDDFYEVIVVHDGIPNGHPLRLRVPR